LILETQVLVIPLNFTIIDSGNRITNSEDQGMPNDPHFDDEQLPEDWQHKSEGAEIPASVTFMEMMRHAAAKAAPPPATPVEQLFTRPVDIKAPSSTRATGEVAAVAAPATATLTAQELAGERRHDAAIEEQRVRRVKKRRARRRQRTVGMLGGIIRSLIVVVIAAGLMATIFTWWTPSQFLADNVKQELSIAQATGLVTAAPTVMPTPNWLKRVGIVSGHRGPQVPPDPGAVCPDGLTEASVNFAVAQLVVLNLRAQGYSVDLLDEFDPRLEDYQAAALVSIHANTCQVWPGEVVSGYLIARAAARNTLQGNDDILVNCVAQYYGLATNLERREGVTVDMTDYHTFREIHPLTPATILELGFLLADRTILTEKQAEMAQGITNGILCFLQPNQRPATETPLPGTAQP
jgi:N-acetylmuramoyl-L-alanine amidase